MTVDINIGDGNAATFQGCPPTSTGTGDDFALYSKIASAFALVLFVALASSFVSLRRAIKAVHADLVKTRSAGVRDRTSAIPTNSNEAEPIQPEAAGSQVLDPDVSDQSDTEQVGQPSVWRELRLVTVAWLEQSLTAVTAAAMGVISGISPDAGTEEMLPSPVAMT